MYQIIGTGSNGNCLVYHGNIMVDCGVAFDHIKPIIKNIQIVLLTHSHGDHIKPETLKKLMAERPTVRIGCCEWMTDFVKQYPKNVDVYEIGKIYNYGAFRLSPVKLYHDVENCGYRIFKGEHKLFHATDTAHLEGITAKGYDLFAIEHNYDADTVWESIARIEAAGGFAHQRGSINSHLSEQQAREFISANRKPDSVVVRLHESKTV